MVIGRKQGAESDRSKKGAERQGKTNTQNSRHETDSIRVLHHTFGNQAVQELVEREKLQPKLRDRYGYDRSEREADRVAERVQWTPRPVTSVAEMSHDALSIDRLSPVERSPVVRGSPFTPSAVDGSEQWAQRAVYSTAPPSVGSPAGDVDHDLREGTGRDRPLPASIRSILEPQFGLNFSSVRVHSDRRAAELTTQLNAQAFTYGRHIYFRPGNYDVTTESGRKLLTHELAHVVQQQSVSRVRSDDPERRASPSWMSADSHETTRTGDDVPDVVSASGLTRLAGPTVQRRPQPGLTGTSFGSIAFGLPGGGLHQGDIRIEAELVPDGERPGRFAGYTDRLLAVARCWRENALCAVFEDDSGRFHAVRTNWPGRDPRVERLQLSPSERFSGLQWVHPTDVTAERAAEGRRRSSHGWDGQESWSDRVRRVKRWHRAWEDGAIPRDFQPNDGDRTRAALRAAIEREFVSLLAETLGIGTNEIHVARGTDDREPNRINFDLTLEAQGRGGIGGLPDDRESDDLPEPNVVFGPAAIDIETRTSLLATAIHEATHYAHGRQTVELWDRWRRSRSRRTFVGWLRRRRRVRDDAEAEILAEEEVLYAGPEPSTEALARMEAFVATYTDFELTETQTRFEPLDTMPRYWNHADPEVKETVMRRLATYVGSLPRPYREDLRAHVDEKLEAIETNQILPRHVAFWERFARDVLPANTP